MVNIEDFIKRLEIILDYYSLNASSFADKIGVQRSSLSHLLSGRNKPSLDFILKILEVFPDVDLYWILNGKGTFPKNSEQFDKTVNNVEQVVKQNIPAPASADIIPENLFSEIKIPNPIPALETKKIENKNSPKESDSTEIDKIVIFYKNGTFKSYVPD
ncbi:XRE family transcriptional regulator [Flavobacterium petrolei]|jgi:transcriptional regulator with XRE-family HTH domain|uniref:XRE family transcriptional regulator n=1 Tax=Flavobacterium petrolei TaxID=2259594 RepID=A0A482TQ18_9FLAO|nr:MULTISPECIES: helix-turn-helix transcriptional regulator [Flavobacterium]MDD2821427.1 helix-turn-helix transcriptional regulator [Flavobacterium sp.]QIH37567.1 helix-turn-helix transcriptional regulator [Flavobacterium sp. Sr18]RYJ52099.1 XRE family transcriptional regulator [Flavobacterium petrolei]